MIGSLHCYVLHSDAMRSERTIYCGVRNSAISMWIVSLKNQILICARLQVENFRDAIIMNEKKDLEAKTEGKKMETCGLSKVESWVLQLLKMLLTC